MKLSIIIVNYNDRENTLKLLSSIDKNMHLRELEIILIDNASVDGSVEAIKTTRQDIKVIANTVNVGFPKAVNQGIKASSGDYVLLLNPDIEIKDSAIDKLVAFLDEHQDVGAAGGKILNPDGSIQLSGKSFPDPMVMLFVTFNLHRLFPNNPVTKGYYHSIEDYDKPHEVEHITASFLMVRRSAIDQVGMMDENIFLYCEDVDWCYRLHKEGYKIWYVPDSEVVHLKGASTSKASYRSIIEYHKSAWYFYKKYYWDKYPRSLSIVFYVGLQLRKYWHLIANFFSREKKVRY